MNKPITLQVQELENNLIQKINDANLPAFCIKIILNDISQKINEFDLEEIKKYNEFLEEEKNKEFFEKKEE